MHWWIRHNLVAYAAGDLTPDQERRIEAHLQSCSSCREEVAALRLGIAQVRDLPVRKAPDTLWERLEPKLDALSQGADQPLPSPAGKSAPRRPRIAVGLALGAACALGIWLHIRRTVVAPSGPTWQVTRLAGTPRVGNQAIGAAGRLGVGQWLSTDAASQARLQVANIGEVVLDANSRLRLQETGRQEHRLELKQGTIHAHISAPPRLFLVDTPATRAIDLGCTYTLQVAANGDTLLHVTLGKVALVRKEGGEEVIPAGALCTTRQGMGPGTPVFEDAPQALQDALARYDFDNGGEEALNAVLKEARERDTLTLWYLFVRVPESDRGRLYDRLTAFVPPPPGTTKAEMMRLDPKTIEAWRGQMEQEWLGG